MKDSWGNGDSSNIMETINLYSLKQEEWGGGMMKYTKDKLNLYKHELKMYRSRRDVLGVRKYSEAQREFLNCYRRKRCF